MIDEFNKIILKMVMNVWIVKNKKLMYHTGNVSLIFQ